MYDRMLHVFCYLKEKLGSLNYCFAGNWRPAEVKRCNLEWGRHCFTTSPDFRVKEADGSIKRVPIKVGAELSVCSRSYFFQTERIWLQPFVICYTQ